MAAEAVAATHAAEMAAVLPSREAILTVAVPRAHRDAAATMTAKVLAGTPEAAIGRATGKVVGSTITARISAALVLTSSSMAAAYGYNDCGWLRRQAVITGSPYWWRRYQDCLYYD